MGSVAPYRATLVICLAEVLGLAAIAAFPALLPTFQAQWDLSNTAAGWISAAYYAGYMLSVPLLAGITDRMDARRIMALGALLGVATALGYALLARGFWSALVLRWLAGIGLAGIYMPGLKLVSDQTEGALQSRFVSFYTASFGLGMGLSYLMAGEINALAGWRWAFLASAIAAAMALLVIWRHVPRGVRLPSGQPLRLADFVTVLRCRPAMAYVLGYAAHMWELFAFRTWIVAFLVFSMGYSLDGDGDGGWRPTQVAFLANLVGLASSIAGNELARIHGRQRVIAAVMLLSAACGAGLGFMAPLPYAWVALGALVYGLLVTADSAALTAGAVAAAPAGLRGTTLAVHSTIGFGAAFAGPLAVGLVLDAFGGATPLAWGMGFVTMAVGCLVGPLILAYYSDHHGVRE